MKMTANRRIALNIGATYLRSLYKLALGLVTARWLLLALGQTDYGLMGVVGGLIAFVTLINRLLAGSVSRYYAVSIGLSRKKGRREEGLDECRRWFTVAVSVHTVIPFVLVAIGYPLGLYAVDHWLVIPPDRLAACRWVWTFSCLSALVSMVNVPFRAMYTAKQEIAELTIYSMAETTLMAFLLYYMVSHPGVWLAKYAFWHCLLAVLPKVLICLRAILVYPECRIRREFLWNFRDIRELASFACWNAIGSLGRTVKSQGIAILVNRAFGAAQNAAMTVANRLSARASTFSTSLVSAFIPAITSAWGAGNREKMLGLVYRVDKLAASLVCVTCVPLVIEVHEVMRLWLKKPPAESPILCIFVIVASFLNEISIGQSAAIAATGRVALNRALVGLANLLAIPACWMLFKNGCGLYSVAYVSLSLSVVLVFLRLGGARRVAGVSVRHWFRFVWFPIFLSGAAAVAVGLVPRLLMERSIWRILIVGVAVESVLLPLVWYVVFEDGERAYVLEKGRKVLSKLTERKERT